MDKGQVKQRVGCEFCKHFRIERYERADEIFFECMKNAWNGNIEDFPCSSKLECFEYGGNRWNKFSEDK